MLIRKKRWLLVLGLFVVAPMVGFVAGVFGGVHMTHTVDDASEADEVVVIDSVETEDGAEATGPTVTLPNGEDVGVDELAPGRKVAVVVMKHPKCPVCQQQLEGLSTRLSEIERAGGTVVGLTDANTCTARGLMGRFNLGFPVVSDTDGELLEELGLTLPDRPHVMPGIVFVDEDGEIEDVHQGRAPGQQDAQQRLIMRWLAD